MGIARLGGWHIKDDIERGDLIPLLETFNPCDLEMINAVYVGGGQIPRRVRAFIEYMVETVTSSSRFVGTASPNTPCFSHRRPISNAGGICAASKRQRISETTWPHGQKRKASTPPNGAVLATRSHSKRAGKGILHSVVLRSRHRGACAFQQIEGVQDGVRRLCQQ
jgi:hypothetical protein